MGGYGGRGRQPGLGLLLLAAQVHRLGIENIPAVTLALMGINVGAYLGFIPGLGAGVWRLCMSYHNVIYYGEHYRLLTSLFSHADDFHLSFNMSSLMWKGYNLERALGLPKFLAMVLIFIVATPLLHLCIVWLCIAAQIGDVSKIAHSCSVGFSGVLFALKVVTTVNSERMHDVFFGLCSVEGKYVVWAELVLIHFIHPGSSFIGHLAGILAGLAYERGFFAALTPILEGLIEATANILQSTLQANNQRFQQRQERYTDDYGDGGGGGGGGGDGNPGGMRDDEARRQAAEAALRRRRGY